MKLMIEKGGIPMSEHNQDAPKKKLSLQEIMQQQLEAKKNKNSQAKGSLKGDQSTKKLSNQASKKMTSTRRKMGS